MVDRLQYWWIKHNKPPIPQEVERDMEKVDKLVLAKAWIHDRTSEFWNGPYNEVYRKVKRKIILGDDTVYPGISIEALLPLITTMRETVEGGFKDEYDPLAIRVSMSIIPRCPKDLPHNKIRIGYGQTVNHFNHLFPGWVFDERYKSPLSFTLIDSPVDPIFNVDIIKKDSENIRDEYALEMNVNKLKRLCMDSKTVMEYLKANDYSIKVNEPISCYYVLEGLPGRRKEMSPVPLKV